MSPWRLRHYHSTKEVSARFVSIFKNFSGASLGFRANGAVRSTALGFVGLSQHMLLKP